MKAATNIVIGTTDEEGTPIRVEINQGEEIPSEMLSLVGDELILEKIAKNDPNALTREQLLVMAGIGGDGEEGVDEEEVDEEEVNEDQFREALKEFKNVTELADWAKNVLGMDVDPKAQKREELEEMIVAEQFGE